MPRFQTRLPAADSYSKRDSPSMRLTNMICCLTAIALDAGMASQRISVRVPGGIARRLKERSRATNTRESQVVRDALEQYLSTNDSEQTTYDLLREAGLIGCVRGAPRDLSTNKRYFKGFGESK